MRALADDLDRAVSVIEDASGRSPTVYRPPYGVFTAGCAGTIIVMRKQDFHEVDILNLAGS